MGGRAAAEIIRCQGLSRNSNRSLKNGGAPPAAWAPGFQTWLMESSLLYSAPCDRMEHRPPAPRGAGRKRGRQHERVRVNQEVGRRCPGIFLSGSVPDLRGRPGVGCRGICLCTVPEPGAVHPAAVLRSLRAALRGRSDHAVRMRELPGNGSALPLGAFGRDGPWHRSGSHSSLQISAGAVVRTVSGGPAHSARPNPSCAGRNGIGSCRCRCIR